MARFSTILFDLDGTLTDPAIGITNSVMFALKYFDITVADRRDLYPFIGPPLVDSFMEQFGFSKEQALKAVGYYREYFREKGLFENTPYPKIAKLLSALKKSGKRLYVATSKPEEFAVLILSHFKLLSFFDGVVGATLDGRLSEKCDVIAETLTRYKITDLPHTAMVGDRKFDILGGLANRLTPIGVLYGFGSREELTAAGADLLAADWSELQRILKE